MMETDLAGNRSCTLIVTDSVGDIADSTQVQFYTNATTYDPPPDQSDLGDKVGGKALWGVASVLLGRFSDNPCYLGLASVALYV